MGNTLTPAEEKANIDAFEVFGNMRYKCDYEAVVILYRGEHVATVRAHRIRSGRVTVAVATCRVGTSKANHVCAADSGSVTEALHGFEFCDVAGNSKWGIDFDYGMLWREQLENAGFKVITAI